MTDQPQSTSPASTSASASRRDFLKGSTAAMVATGLTVPLVHAAGSSTIKVGLVGCGGRGSGAAEQALTADSNAKLVAMADAFQDRLEDHLSTLKQSPVALGSTCPRIASILVLTHINT